MPTLNTGLIISGGYADKARKTLFAQLRADIKEGRVSSQEVARAVAELNQTLYKVLVEGLKTERGDVVRVRVDYELADGRIVWKWSSLRVEYFKRIPDGEVEKTVREALSRIQQEEITPTTA